MIKQLIKLVDQVDINELGMRMRLEAGVKRFSKFQRAIGAEEIKLESEEVNIRQYVKYLLKEGSIVEKRELLANLQSKIVYQDKTLELLNNIPQ